MRPYFLPISRLAEQPYSQILGYPKASRAQIRSRISELRALKVDGVAFVGPMLIGKTYVLGKGYTGIVVLAKLGGRKVALKIRRTDSPRKSMADETALLVAANKVNVGPKMIASSRNFLAMEFLDGIKIHDWVCQIHGRKAVKQLKSILRKILLDCQKLDGIGLDHGELSYISKHVIVGKKTTIIDFESSSLERRASNVTSAAQGLYIGSGLSKIIQKTCPVPPKNKIIAALREYKRNQTRESFENILGVLKIRNAT
ncbi:serine/threonine protein kinase [Candidatus Nitrosotenuis uzonensis]|uniref:Putative serine/threonine protein kinase n=1 Tax=Candidatus Nitrosotenuis uzonensis TaxID=1407055 RepID=A0A812F0D3_9ARCH|nr:serine/threonine protein kinase [Candidatus Nitrosotenuis uzonensis]CAE6489126.1 putative serine/threonine protein kinase [Candidatus Nitrosotenuis uzonensis]